MNRSLVALGLVAVLGCSACGRQVALRPKAGEPTVPKAHAATAPETAAQLMTPSTQARPRRNEDLIYKSEPRREDPFRLPPGADNGR
jgi:hypothetical protein